MVIDVDFYELPNGEEPARIFLDSLNLKMRAKMYREIDLLIKNGPELFELRAKQGSDISRVMYFFFYGGKAILTNGFIKKTDKTPKSAIDLAKNTARIMSFVIVKEYRKWEAILSIAMQP